MKVFSSQYLEDLINEASQSHRLRAHANVHGSYADQCQKLFNAIQVDSYIRPHRHSLDPRDEYLIAVRVVFTSLLLLIKVLMSLLASLEVKNIQKSSQLHVV